MLKKRRQLVRLPHSHCSNPTATFVDSLASSHSGVNVSASAASVTANVHQPAYSGTRVVLTGAGGGLVAPPVSRAAGGGSASKSASPAVAAHANDQSSNASALGGVALSPILRDNVSPDPPAVSLQAAAQVLALFLCVCKPVQAHVCELVRVDCVECRLTPASSCPLVLLSARWRLRGQGE